MNDHMRFPGLIEGPSNRIAYAASIAAVACPGEAYNPLWLHGPSGTGKTALLCAMLQRLRERCPELRIRRIQAEELIGQMVNAIQADTQEEFRAGFAGLDVLAVDHLELLRGKDTTQMLLGIFLAELTERGCQVLLASVHSPEVLESLHSSLERRCTWLLELSLREPDDQERLSGLEQMSLERELRLPEPLALRIVRGTRSYSQIRCILNQLALRRRLLRQEVWEPEEILDTILQEGVCT